jgi:flap endonuclease-1
MGIEGLTGHISKKISDAEGKIALDEFKGMKVAIDAAIVMWKMYCGATKNVLRNTDIVTSELDDDQVIAEWLKMLIKFAIKWLETGITPIFVFDGKPYKEKQIAWKKRAEAKNKGDSKLADAMIELKNSDPLKITPAFIAKVKKMMGNSINMDKSKISIFKELLQDLGIPCLQAKHDGEQLCSYLCKEGKVAAVYSTDGDTLTWGCPLLLKSLCPTKYGKMGERSYRANFISGIWVKHVLGMSDATFIDMCIMCGCDFNNNIPGIAIGRAKTLMQKYGSIENALQDSRLQGKDISCLNHIRLREIFSYRDSKDVTASGYLELNSERFKVTGRSSLSKYDCLDHISPLAMGMQKAINCRNKPSIKIVSV